MNTETGRSVGQIAALAGVTVRTLHHYDEIGLLSPSERTHAGYRLYGDADLARLQSILFYRELGFGLDAIADLLDDPAADSASHLRRQRELLADRRDRLDRMIDAVDKTLEATRMNLNLTPEERLEVFGSRDPAQYAEEADQRWGDTDAYQESHRRTRGHTKDDWLTIQAEIEEIEAGFASALSAGVPADDARAGELAERHRTHIGRWFYDCELDMHRSLADMYLADPRFTAHYDDRAPGLAAYVTAAIYANADRAGRA